MDHISAVYERLVKLKNYDDAAQLFSTLLNYEYSSQKISTKRFPASLDGKVSQLNVLATHDDFKVIHCELDKLLLGTERPVINNLLRDHPYSLFLFSDVSKSQWHFINVKYDEEESRRKIFRRIVVGPDERLHTAAQRISMLDVPDAGTISPLALQLKHDEAFDVEKVTKEFFSSFVAIYRTLTDEIEELNPRYAVKAGEYSQTLLDRLMFLYFIQKKGWLNANKNFLFDHFKKGYSTSPDKQTFYSEIVLRVFQKLAISEELYTDLGVIPFLNGGLFEINDWEPSLKIRNKTFAKMFKYLFEHYNFTVREDTAMDMEVAIDPEMLGKVFENLILTLEKDPKTDLRKSTGSYYTPRVIVHYMCQQSLKEYLIENAAREEKTKRDKFEKLITLNPAEQLTEEEKYWLKSAFTHAEAAQIKHLILSCRVCDPAVGSGAFVVGMLHDMLSVIKLCDYISSGEKEIQKPNYDYELKRKIIEHCLYGVDIQEQAVRICELRLWLSLVVDYNGTDIPPLPNLSYRIRQGNSLIDQMFGHNVNLNVKQGTERGEKIKQLIDAIQNDKHAYFYESDAVKKRKADLKIMAKQCDLATLYLTMRKHYVAELFESKFSKGLFGEYKLKKVEEDERDTLKKEIKELDRIVFLAKNTKDKLLAIERGKLRDTEQLKHLVQTFVWKLDFAEVFREKDGFDVIVANPPYLNAKQFPELKDLLNQKYDSPYGSYDIYIVFMELGILLINDKGIQSLITSNKFLLADYGARLRKFLREHASIKSFIDLADCTRVFEALVSPAISIISRGKTTLSDSIKIGVLKGNEFNDIKDGYLLETKVKVIQKEINAPFDIYVKSSSNLILSKIEQNSLPLKSLGLVRTGIMGFNYWSLEPFIKDIPGNNKEGMIKMLTNSHIEPFRFLHGKEITLYKNRYTNPKININCKLINDSTREFFLTKKVAMRGVAMHTTAAWDNEGQALLVAVHGFAPEQIDGMYVTALLNSELFDWLHKIKFYAARIPKGSLRYPISFWESLPIIQIDKNREKKINALSIEIMVSKDIKKIAVLKQKINEEVFDIYKINKNELK
jgi:hypothetical protein